MIGELILPCFVLLMQNGVPTRLTVSHPIITLSFRVLPPSLLPLVAEVLMSWCRIGVERITRFALRWVSSWTPFEFSRLVPAVELWLLLNGRRPIFGLFYVMGPPGLSHSSGRFWSFPPLRTLFWRAQVRGRSISLTRPFFTVAQNSESWLCVWILGGFLVLSWIVFGTWFGIFWALFGVLRVILVSSCFVPV